MQTRDHEHAQQFAVDVVKKLREAGFEAYWAGGCVRDRLLGLAPKDYDVATSAPPDEIRRVFGKRHTRAVGAAFGVICVIGSKRAGTIEVATFRRDAAYSDGRHPDAVTFSTAEHDAQRRDFTINGLFFDPLAQRVIDFVGGQRDLQGRVVRAIGDAEQRLHEDRLRMLRAVRFAATFDFALDEGTLAAIQKLAHSLVAVSAERIAGELRMMLTGPNRVRAVELMRESGLLEVVLPESAAISQGDTESDASRGETAWARTMRMLGHLQAPSFALALAVLLREFWSSAATVREIGSRWRLSNAEIDTAAWLLSHVDTARQAKDVAWSRLQPILAAPHAVELVALAEAIVHATAEPTTHVDYCRQKLALPPHELDPPALLDGDDLKACGVPAGPVYRDLLTAVRDAQLEGAIADKPQALDLALRLWRQESIGET
jgi:tRNA nucleotidyltransferase/poly(A) polymerase